MAEFDIIVVGSGMSGGWVAKEMCERGLKTLVIERGRQITLEDYTDMVDPWDNPHIGRASVKDKERQPIQSQVYAYNPLTTHYWVDDVDSPYESAPGQDYRWYRGNHTGGRSMMWGRQSYRMSEIDFEANKKDGHGVDWPVRYKDIAPWYDHVERFAGISGSKEGLEILPDGVFQPPHDLTCGEIFFRDKIESAFPGRRLIPGRAANLTEPTEEQIALGRGRCQARNQCERGCSFGAYFNSNVATLPAARNTGNLTMMTDSAVHSVDYDPETKRATAVNIVNTKTKERSRVTARVIFLNASTIATTTLLLNSKSESFQNGLANSSGQLGRNLMDHMITAWGHGYMTGDLDKYMYGRRPNGFYIPRFRNHTEDGEGFVRGFCYQGGAGREGWQDKSGQVGVGIDFKAENRVPGRWKVGMAAFCEVLPDERNQVTLHDSRTDAWGLAIPVINHQFRENEAKIREQACKDTRAMFEAAGLHDIFVGKPTEHSPEGAGIHEMGTARMGRDPKTSVLNEWNQSWDVANLFVTDGSFMASGGCQNPSLSYMAFSARAADHAAKLMKDGIL